MILSGTLWGSWARRHFWVPHFLIAGNRFHSPPRPSLSSDWASSKSCSSGKRREAGTREEVPGSNSAALGQVLLPRKDHCCGLVGPQRVIAAVPPFSRVRLFVTPWTAARLGSLSITHSWSLLKPMSIELVMPSKYLILRRPLLLPPSIFPSIRVFSNESALCIRWPKCWSFSFNISPSNEYSGLISFRMDRLDLLAVQGTLKGLLQHHSSKASILQHSAFFIVQHSYPYVITGKTIALTRWTFVDNVMSLLFNMLSRLVIAFLPGSKHLISWLQSPSAVILEPKKIKSLTFSIVFLFICHEMMVPDVMISVF